jgi:hypothetical protein
MMGALFTSFGLAAITAAPGTPAPAAGAEVPEIRDIAPPLDVFPYPPWMVAVAATLVLIILGLLVWLIVKWVRSRPGPPPLSAFQVALGELEKLRARSSELEPYSFSIAVSDVLRTFITNARFRLPATHQTSPEFLAAISDSPLFSEKDRTLLAGVLEKTDMIKFARWQATSADNVELVESALTFVRGGQA